MNMAGGRSLHRRWFAPEVVQTSAMDCGPATLKCLLEGFGVPVSYGRLREACQTDVDGTSIDTLEEIAVQLGLEAEQIMVPLDHLLLPEADAWPAIVVVRQPNGLTHFVVAWRLHGPLVQLMDPSTGRRWLTGRRFLDEVYLHEFPMPVAQWREWAGTEEFLAPLQRRMARLGVAARERTRLVNVALSDEGWRSLAALDAATRLTTSIVRAGGLPRGPNAARVLGTFFDQERKGTPSPAPPSDSVGGGGENLLRREAVIPTNFWCVQPATPAPDGEQRLVVRGAVVVRVNGCNVTTTAGTEGLRPESERGSKPLSPELVAALTESRSRPGVELLKLLREDGLFAPLALLFALFLAAGAVVMEAVLFRGLVDVGRQLNLSGQRLGAMSALFAFLGAVLLLELPIAGGLFRLGRRLEVRLRVAFLEKLPRLVDRYFQSRLTSDMAERCHSIHSIRELPELGGWFLRTSFEMILTIAGIAWLDPASAPIAVLAGLLAVGVPLLANPLLIERELRMRTHVGALGRFYLDALLGLVPIRMHAAERNIRTEHESLLVEWARAGLRLQRAVVSIEGIQLLFGFGLVAWLLFHHAAHGGELGAVLLLVYWALNLPVLGHELALLARQYPVHRNLTLRLLEPLGAPEQARPGEATSAESTATASMEAETVEARSADVATSHPGAVSISFRDVAVRAGGHPILQNVSLDIAAGGHVAIVGPSGAGKSTLVGLVLGWHRAAHGQVLVNEEPLDSRKLEQLRQQTAWVDPTVQLWNRSLFENLAYGSNRARELPVGWAVEQARLRHLLEQLPQGLQTPLGESGALVSGGEGQRVRFARALLRDGVRLAILDEPFRGLDRELRRELLALARQKWREATLLCITHDIGETLTFERVLVVEAGRVVEDGNPTLLAECSGSRYQTLLAAESAVREGLWSSGQWLQHRLENGRLRLTTTGVGNMP